MGFIIDPYRFGSSFPQPFAYYALESDGTDSTSNSYDATTETDCTFSSAVVSNGVDGNNTTTQMIFAGYSPDPFINMFYDGSSEKAGSIAFWVKFNTITNNDRILSTRLSGTLLCWEVHVSGTNLRFAIYDTDGSNYIYVQYTGFSTATWYHIVFTYSGNQADTGLNMYVDGSNVGTAGTTGTYTQGENDGSALSFMSMNQGGSPTLHFNGSVDELGFWGEELTSDNVSYLYNSGTGRTWPL